MTLALLVPNDLHHDPVLVRFDTIPPAHVEGDPLPFTAVQERRGTLRDDATTVRALRSFGDRGGAILHINRGDETPAERRRRR